MSYDSPNDPDYSTGLFSPWEQECADEVDNDPDMTDGQHSDCDIYGQNLWYHFQSTADAISHLYKDRVNSTGTSVWEKFQHAAGTATLLYKEGVAGQNKMFEIGVDVGRRRRTKELISWLRARRRHIRRDELLSFLCGKPPPPRHSRTSSHVHRYPSATDGSAATAALQDQSFRESVALQGLTGTLSDISVSYSRPRTPGSPHLSPQVRHRHHHFLGGPLSGPHSPDHHQTTRKRSASNSEHQTTDLKRFRFNC